MMVDYRIEFEALEWEHPFDGVRHKILDQEGLRMRLVEYSREMPPHWCERGHFGCLLEGEMEITFTNETMVYTPGDGIFIPDGAEHKHKAAVLTDRAVAFFVEQLG
jgi:quercetin dioxygenase-like cupin family protein